MLNICPVCGDDIPRKCLKFCGKKCYARARERRVLVTCVTCNTLFDVRPFEAKRSKTHHCTRCRAQWENRETPDRPLKGLMLNCYWCGSPVYRQPYYYRRYLYTFCSKQCRSAGWRSLRLAHEGLFGKRQP